MNPARFAPLVILGFSIVLASCGKQEESKPQAKAEAPKPSPIVVDVKQETPKTAVEPAKPAPAPKAMASGHTDFGEFGSSEPLERKDLPDRGILAFPVLQDKHFTNAAHWEQYNFPFTTKRWGKYAVRLTYELKTSSLGVQFKFGEDRLKKQLTNTNGTERSVYLGEIYIPTAGDHFMGLYTPQSVGFIQFFPKSIDLVPAAEGGEVAQAGDGTVALLAKDATTWSENMRYEPKPEKNCLGFWSDEKDFAEWEFKVEKPGKYKVTVHQGSATGGSEVAVHVGGEQFKFTVQNTGDFHKFSEVPVGELDLKPGTYRLAVKPQSKNGGAIMDVQKVVLAPVS